LFPSDLENEADELFDMLLQMISSSSRSQLVNAVISSIVLVVKRRPTYVAPATEAMIAWTSTTYPTQARWNETQQKSVERGVRDGLLSILRHIPPLPMPNPIVDTLISLGATWNNFPQPYSQKLKEQQREKRSRPSEAPFKRQRERPTAPASIGQDFIDRMIPLLSIDVAQVPIPVAVDHSLHALRGITDQQWAYAMHVARSLPQILNQVKQQGYRTTDGKDGRVEKQEPEEPEEDEDLGQDEAADVAAMALVRPPTEISADDRRVMLKEMVNRMIQSGEAFDGRFKAARKTWELLLCRLVGRTAASPEFQQEAKEEFGEALKDAIVDFVTDDFRSRIDLAVSFLHELWFDDLHDGEKRHESYIKHFQQILWALPETLEPGDRLFTRFLLDVPMVDEGAIRELVMGQMIRNPDSEDRDAIELGISTLRDLVLLRPALRALCLDELMNLTTDIDKTTRQFAIQTVTPWTPNHRTLGPNIETFALDALPRIAQNQNADAEGDTDMATGPVQTIAENEDDLWGADASAIGNQEVARYLDLYIALCSSNPDLLVHIFKLYPTLSPSVQRSVRAEIYPVVRTLGMSSPQLIKAIRNLTPGTETLALKCIWDLLDRGTKPTKELIAIIKTLIVAKKVDAKALLAILSSLEKQEVISYLPRIVSLIPADSTDKRVDIKSTKPYQAIRDVFVKLVTAPAEGERPVLKPEELLIALLNMEDQVGVKRLVPATQICFDMVDLFKPEQLGLVMRQVVENKKIPTIFMRTVLQAVTTYKSMASFVQTILGRLVQRKVWETKPLWDGFIRCCRVRFYLNVTNSEKDYSTLVQQCLDAAPTASVGRSRVKE
jgi:symplekin